MIAMSSVLIRCAGELAEVDLGRADATSRRPCRALPSLSVPAVCPTTSVRKTPSLRRTARRVLARVGLPQARHRLAGLVESLLYSKTGIADYDVLLGDAQDLGDGGLAARDLARAVVEQGAHALRDRALLDGARVDVLEDELADRRRRRTQELVDAGAAAVAVAVARGAARRPCRSCVTPNFAFSDCVLRPSSRSSSSVGSYGSRQSGQTRRTRRWARIAGERRGDEERLDAHVDEAGDGAGGVVGVHGGEHEVAGERGLDRDLGGLLVADLADHDDVGVLAEEGAQRRWRR